MTPRPASSSARPGRFAAALLAVALLLAQLGLITHAADHALHADDSVCVVCLHAQAPAAGAVVTSPYASVYTAEASPGAAAAPRAQHLTSFYFARAPPPFSR